MLFQYDETNKEIQIIKKLIPLFLRRNATTYTKYTFYICFKHRRSRENIFVVINYPFIH